MKDMFFVNKGIEPLKETVEGIVCSREDMLKTIENDYSYVVIKRKYLNDTVRILINGGGGRGPFFEGCVAEGMADGAISGDFNCAPNAFMIYQTAKQIDCGKGVLLLTNNFMGDYLNNDMAKELLEDEGIQCKVCYVSDDLYSARGEAKRERGGLSGIGLVMKAAAAVAAVGGSLDEVFACAEKVNDRVRSVTFCHNEKSGRIEFGNGFSGEAPAFDMPMEGVDKIAEKVVDEMLKELGVYKSDTIHIVVNRMLYMSFAESYIVLNSLKCELERRGLRTGRCNAGYYFDAFDYNGAIISFLAADEELDRILVPISNYDFTI